MTQIEADRNRYVVYLRDSFNPNRSSNATDGSPISTRSRRGARRKSPSPSTWEWSDLSWEEGHLDEILDSLIPPETNSTITAPTTTAAVSGEFRHKHRLHSRGRSHPRHHPSRKHHRHKSREGSGRVPELRAGDMKRPFIFSDHEALRLKWGAELNSRSRQSRERLPGVVDEKAARGERRWWSIPFSYAFGSTKSR